MSREQHPLPDGSTKVKQSERDASDIRRIYDRFRSTGEMTTGKFSRREIRPVFGDFSGIDFHRQMNQVMQVREQFDSLKPSLRRRFMGSPALLVEWVNRPENRLEAIKMGLVVPTDEEVEAIEAEARSERKKAADAAQVDLVEQSAQAADPESQPDYRGKKAPKKGAE